MTPFALIVKHRTQAGKRDDVRKVWEKHMAPAISATQATPPTSTALTTLTQTQSMHSSST